jgi:hypothetical protein
MYLQKVISQKNTSRKNLFFYCILKATAEKCRIWIRIQIYNQVYGCKGPDPVPSQNVTDLEHWFFPVV